MIYDDGDHTFDNLAETVKETVAALKPHAKEFDSIAVRGVSGVIVGSPVAIALKKPLIVVRKPDEMRHSSHAVENFSRVGDRYLFLDDFVALGGTRQAVADAIYSEGGPDQPVAQYLYEDRYYEPLPAGCLRHAFAF